MSTKVLYVYFTNHHCRSAHNNQILHTCNSLVDQGFAVTLATRGGIEAYSEAHGLRREFSISRLPVPDVHETFAKVCYYTGSLLIASRYDLVFTRDISFLKFLSVVPDISRPTVVYEAHKSYSQTGEMTEAEEIDRVSEADGIVTLTDGIREDLEALGFAIDAIIPDAANINLVPRESKKVLRRELDIEDEDDVVLYAGSLTPWKNDVELVIRSIRELSRTQDGVSLVIVGGSESLIEKLRSFAKTVDVAKDVRFAGHVSQREAFQYMKAADVGMVPLKVSNVRASKYTSPLKLFEYLICGLQVVASDVPAVREIADSEPNIHLYQPGDRDDLAYSISVALERKSASDVGDRWESYSYDHRGERLGRVFQNAISR